MKILNELEQEKRILNSKLGTAKKKILAQKKEFILNFSYFHFWIWLPFPFFQSKCYLQFIRKSTGYFLLAPYKVKNSFTSLDFIRDEPSAPLLDNIRAKKILQFVVKKLFLLKKKVIFIIL